MAPKQWFEVDSALLVSKKNGHTVAIQKGPLELTGLTVFNFKYCAVY